MKLDIIFNKVEEMSYISKCLNHVDFTSLMEETFVRLRTGSSGFGFKMVSLQDDVVTRWSRSMMRSFQDDVVPKWGFFEMETFQRCI